MRYFIRIIKNKFIKKQISNHKCRLKKRKKAKSEPKQKKKNEDKEKSEEKVKRSNDEYF